MSTATSTDGRGRHMVRKMKLPTTCTPSAEGGLKSSDTGTLARPCRRRPAGVLDTPARAGSATSAARRVCKNSPTAAAAGAS